MELKVPTWRPPGCDEEAEEVPHIAGEDERDAAHQSLWLEESAEGECWSFFRRRAGIFLFYKCKFPIHVNDKINKYWLFWQERFRIPNPSAKRYILSYMGNKWKEWKHSIRSKYFKDTLEDSLGSINDKRISTEQFEELYRHHHEEATRVTLSIITCLNIYFKCAHL
jgi:hypothetical protein